VNRDLREIMRDIRDVAKGNRLPPDVDCPTCGKVRLDQPGVEDVLVSRGIPGRAGAVWACVCDSQEAFRLRKAREAAGLPDHNPPRDFDNFAMVAGTEAAWDAARVIATRQGPTSLFFSGDTGCGKTHLLEAIGWYAMGHATRVRFEYFPGLLLKLQATIGQSGESFNDILEPLDRVPLLLLDEIGLSEVPTDFEVRTLTEIVTGRLASGRHVAITANLLPSDMEARFHPRLASRLIGEETREAKWVTITAPDYRRTGSK